MEKKSLGGRDHHLNFLLGGRLIYNFYKKYVISIKIMI